MYFFSKSSFPSKFWMVATMMMIFVDVIPYRIFGIRLVRWTRFFTAVKARRPTFTCKYTTKKLVWPFQFIISRLLLYIFLEQSILLGLKGFKTKFTGAAISKRYRWVDLLLNYISFVVFFSFLTLNRRIHPKTLPSLMPLLLSFHYFWFIFSVFA